MSMFKKTNEEFVHEVELLSGQNLFSCYQCGKCSAGCAFANFMDMLPHQVIRFLQLKKVEPVIDANTYWYCAACLTCTTRCPKSVDLASIMEALRNIMIRENRPYIQVFSLPVEIIEGFPQQAAVSALRKLSG